MTTTPAVSYQGQRFPAAMIAHAVWRSFRFPLSYRPVAEILAARGSVVSYEAIRQWWGKFGQTYANALQRRQAQPGDQWPVDEVFLPSTGKPITAGGPWINPVTGWTLGSPRGGTNRRRSASSARC